MTVAVVIAGGVGSRMGACVPKQFVEVDGRPVLFWTLEAFQRHPMIDAIELVLIDGWRDVVEDFKNRLGISKLKWIVPGGASAQESIRNGVFALEGVCSPDDIVVVHDGIRPLVESAVLDSVIEVARKFGDGVTSMPYNEQIFVVDEKEPSTTTKYIPRETLRRVATPQAYRFDLIDAAYHEAFEKGIGVHGSAYANTMMVELGRRLHFAAGSDRNLKLTTKGDLAVFKALVETEGPGRNP
ncbi:MAG: 2-C-methyl-D-erythritol 4-phosphate cytidylyltransferase [Kiritimatiellae bacterium]|nr:2-C-methyl-D-erythritol 4-phosphate cytidylyltransferase [Kiritimatiellia bacterium]